MTGLLTRIKTAIGLEQRSTIGVNGWPIVAGATSVTPTSAQSVAACYAAVSLIAEAIGSLPIKLYRRGDNGDRTIASEHPLHGVLHRSPNEYQTPTEYWEWMVSAMLLTGNAYSRVTRGADGQVRSLDPLPPERVTIMRKGDRIAGYEYRDADGVLSRMLPGEVFHLRNRAGTDPLIGVSPIQAARAVIELARSEAQHGQSMMTNGTRASGILSLPGMLKAEQRAALAASWQTQYAGGANAGRVPILESGASFTPISLSAQDAQFIEQRQFSVQEVARIFKVPPVLLGDLSHANFSNSSEMNRWFATHTLGRHVSAIEQAINRQLLTPAAARTLYAEASLEGLLRGASTERAAFYGSAIASGWMLPSEARKLENLPTVTGIDDAPTAPAPAPFGNYPSKQ
jgi:HK97 family phage portal protein